jgi:tetratricopeptide (TPR) repeat protein
MKNLILLIFLLITFGFTQETDDLLLEEDTNVECAPADLSTKYDKYAEIDLEQDLRLAYNFGYEYYKNKNYTSALPYLWKVFVKDNDKYALNSIKKIVEIYYINANADSTLLACYRGLQKFPDLLVLHHYAGIIQEKLFRTKCALPHYEALVKGDSTNVDYLKKLAFLYLKEEQEQAIAMQERVVSLDPSNAAESNLLAQYQAHFWGEGAALQARKDAYLKNPVNLDLALAYGRAALNNGEFKEAIEPFTKIISQKPTAEVYKLRGEVYENLNNFNNAIEDYKKIIEIEPKNAEAMLRISVNYRYQNSFSSASTWINRALSVKPGYGLAYITLGELYESTVLFCQNQRAKSETKYEDKLVYKKAYDIYLKAKEDSHYSSQAKAKMAALVNSIPTKEDEFMHKNDKITSPCYDWLK